MRILIVDDHEVVREGLVATLGTDRRLSVVGAVATAESALAVAKRTVPDVAVVDLRLPDLAGDALCRELRRRFPRMEVVILTTYLNEDTVRQALDAGAAAYVTKAAGLPELRAALNRLLDGARGASGGASQIVKQLHELVAARAEGPVTTPQQGRVLELAAIGLTNQEIGERLFITESTVRFHMQKLKAKLGARSKTELIAKAIRSGVISPAEEDVGAA